MFYIYGLKTDANGYFEGFTLLWSFEKEAECREKFEKEKKQLSQYYCPFWTDQKIETAWEPKEK